MQPGPGRAGKAPAADVAVPPAPENGLECLPTTAHSSIASILSDPLQRSRSQMTHFHQTTFRGISRTRCVGVPAPPYFVNSEESVVPLKSDTSVTPIFFDRREEERWLQTSDERIMSLTGLVA